MISLNIVFCKDFLKKISKFLVALAFFFVFAPLSAGSQKRPNIIFFLTDDQRWDMMGCAGNPIIKTPNMDALAKAGVHFVNAFVTTSICAASRASIFTGLYERTHRFTFGTPPIRKQYVQISYPYLLRKHGYHTAFVGKFGVSVEKGCIADMFDYFRPLHRNPYFKKRPDGTLRHLTDITGDVAISFLRKLRDQQPFCLSVSFNAPHAEDSDPRQYIWPPSAGGLYENAKFPMPKSADPSFFEKQPAFLKKSLNRIRWHWRFDTPEKAQRMIRGYYRMISGVDHVIGRIMKEVKKLGLEENTVVIFSSDNGYFLGERGFAGKWLIHEVSIRVPLIIRDPRSGALKGAKVTEMALNVDIAPTILDLAGVPIPKKTQGRSLLCFLRGKKVPWRKDFFYEHLFEHKAIPKSEGVRTERWTYVRYFEQKPVYEELYDLKNDPDQMNNLAGKKAFLEILKKLRKRCDELRDKYGGPYKPWPKRKR